MNKDYNVNRHSCYKLTYHLVVVTKYRNKVINKEISNRLKEITLDVMQSSFKCDVIGFNCESDHMHILFEAPPQVQISKIVNSLKTVTSRRLRKEFEEHISKYYWKPYFWSLSYFIGTVSNRTEKAVKEYISNQKLKQ